jgi:hypothetical protein
MTDSARVEKGIRKILTGTSVPLDTRLLMGDPLGGLAGRIR